MAKVKDAHLGHIQGKVGNVVYRMIGKKSFVGKAPSNPKKTKSEIAIAVRSSMSALSRFASAVNSSRKLKELWKGFLRDSYLGRKYGHIKKPYNKIVSNNYTEAGQNFLKLSAKVTPGLKDIAVKKFIVNESTFVTEFSVNDYVLERMKENILFIGLLYLSHPINKKSTKGVDNHRFILVEEWVDDFPFTRNLNRFEFSVGKNSLVLIKDFKKVTGFFSIASFPQNKKPLCSNAMGIILKGEDIYQKELLEYERLNLLKAKKSKSAADMQGSLKITIK